ncbi:hypothetical protein A3709_14075 [Halioglobus sp. HI00S01]|uniref:hypothetical protein n=1 Tax=Halioglobus sp. HI00S01 TaxID=1822214 RepID=UPI0007C2D8A3|nr:hypothetical protein [Halioglobus sp. HI00S01]KZX59420.1 hypothetical protein A3709_14075 [Halioglobus sp. HI00S01]
MLSPTSRVLIVVAAAGLLQACAQAPEAPAPVTPVDPSEITLNLPDQQTCDCAAPEPVSLDFLEKGYVELAEGRHAEAMEYFNRYLRMETSRTAGWEAEVAIAFVYALRESPLYDADAARKSYRDLRKEDWQAMELHPQTQLARQALEGFLKAEQERRELTAQNKQLQEDLVKREEALKRLRELTLGRTGSTQ